MGFVRPRDRVMEYSTSNSQSVFAVTGAVDVSHNAFSAAMAVGDTTIGGVVEDGVAFKSGILTYSATDQVTVTAVVESKGTFSASGVKRVFMGLPAALQQLGFASVPPYLGQVATRCFCPRVFNATPKQLMSRSRHRAADAISSLQIKIPNWHVDFNVGGVLGETAVGAAATVTASIEYPAGTFTQVKFAGSATGNIADGASLLSDPVTVCIPQNAFFFVRFFYQNTAGIPYEDRGGDDAYGEAMTYAASGLTDQTMSGTVVQTTAGYRTGPTAIVAMTQRPAIMLLGASNVYGSTDTHDDSTGDIGSLARSIGPSLAYINASLRGDLANYWINNGHAERLALKQYCSHVIVGLGRNDLFTGRTAVQTLADLQSIYALLLDKPIYQVTLEPTSTSTDSWATTVNQTTAAWNGERVTLNASIRAVPAPLRNYIEIADIYETSRGSGIWKAPGYTSDGVHGGAVSNAAVRNSRTVEPVVITQSPAAVPGIIKGAWTPALKFGSNAVGMTYSTQSGQFYRMGDLCFLSCLFILTAKGSSTGDAFITGLPFAIDFDAVATIQPQNMAAGTITYVFASLSAGSTQVGLQRYAAGTRTNLNEGDFTNTSIIRFSMVCTVRA